MGTQVRDAVVAAIAKSPEKFQSAEELAEKLGMNPGATAGALLKLARKNVLKRQKDGREWSYAAGPRINYGLKHAGHKFPQKGKRGEEIAEPVNGNAVPASSGGLGIVVKLDGQAHAITLAQAKELFQELRVLFG